MAVEIRRGADRFAEREPGRATWHSLSFGAHYDPDNLAFGPMVCHDEHLLADGSGFDTHRHSQVVIISRIISGALTHTDSSGATATLSPGQIGLFVPGDGMDHAEIAAAPATRFVQVWLTLPKADGAEADPAQGYRIIDGDTLDLPGASFVAHRLGAGDRADLPAAARVHVFVAAGALARSSLAEPLTAGDAFRLTDEPEHKITATVPTDLLVWAFD